VRVAPSVIASKCTSASRSSSGWGYGALWTPYQRLEEPPSPVV
jgi:hypothetical protein